MWFFLRDYELQQKGTSTSSTSSYLQSNLAKHHISSLLILVTPADKSYNTNTEISSILSEIKLSNKGNKAE